MTVGDNLFVFLDESGDTTFTPMSSKYIVLVALTVSPNWDVLLQEYWALRHDLYINPVDTIGLQQPYTNKRFHATEDPQAVRDRVFSLISDNLNSFKARSLIIEKQNVYEHLQSAKWLYSRLYYYLTRSLLRDSDWRNDMKGIQFIIDQKPTKSATKATIGGTKKALAHEGVDIPFGLHPTPSGCHPFLQLSDYVCWAIYRKYQSNEQDLRSYNIVNGAIEDEWKMI